MQRMRLLHTGQLRDIVRDQRNSKLAQLAQKHHGIRCAGLHPDRA